MDEQLFTVLITIFSGLCLIIGFFISFLLYQILNSQTNLQEKFTVVLARIEAFQAQQIAQDRLIEMVVDELKGKCDISACPLWGNRGNNAIP